MTITRENVTILIQGPLNKVSLDNIENYNKFGKVVVSTWNKQTNEENELKVKILNGDFGEVSELVMTTAPDIEDYPGLSNHSSTTFHYALKGVRDGLLSCNTKYTVRTRSDEFFENLQPLIDVMAQGDNHIVCSNVFFRKDMDYHFGDHLFIGTTESLLRGYLNLIGKITEEEVEEEWNQKATYPEPAGVPEVILGRALTISIENEDTPQKFKECFKEVNVNDLGNFVIRNNHTGQLWRNEYNGNWSQGGNKEGNDIADDYNKGIWWKAKQS
tara:strand:+ start:906 stop:1721 length:816 start_codon:yes stop_codon:yes gene_type:complete